MKQIIETPASVTVRNAGIFAGQLLEAVQAGGDITVDAGALAEADLSFIQLLLAARAHLDREGGRLGLASPAGEALTALLQRAGFLGAAEQADLDFWFHGAMPQ